MGALLWIVVGLLQLRTAQRYAGERGRRRVDALDDDRLRGLHGVVTSPVLTFVTAGGVGVCLLGVALAAVTGPPLTLAGWVAAVVVTGLAAAARRRTAPQVQAAVSERGLSPLADKPHSRRRARRQRQLGVTALVGFFVGQLATFAGERADQPALAALGAITLLVAFVALGILAWTTVWVFRDEDRAVRRT